MLVFTANQCKSSEVALDPTLFFKKHFKKMSNILKLGISRFEHIQHYLSLEAAQMLPFSYDLSSGLLHHKLVPGLALKPLNNSTTPLPQ